MHDEFPHEVIFLKQTKVPDGGAGYAVSWVDDFHLPCFVDTPSSREVFNAHQSEVKLDRNLYFAYRTDIKAKMRCRHKDDVYELNGRPEDQGGLEEIMKVGLKLVPNGK